MLDSTSFEGSSRSDRGRLLDVASPRSPTPSMTIEIEVFGALLPPDKRRQTFQVHGQTTVRQIAQSLGLGPDEIGLITIQGVQSDLDDVVASECRLCFFPPMSGG